MGRLRVWLIVALCGFTYSAGAEDAAAVLTAFGLVGTWSIDCSKPKPLAFTYEIPSVGAPTVTTVDETGEVVEVLRINQAIRVTEEKIKVVSVVEVPGTQSLKKVFITKVGEQWESVIEKAVSKLKFLLMQREDGRKVFVRDGFMYAPPTSAMRDEEEPESWVNTGVAVRLVEKCRN